MSNCTGIIFGRVTGPDSSPISGVDISLNWVQRAEGGPLAVAGDDNMSTFVPRCTTTTAGNYVIPFFWDSTQVPGDEASALAMRWYSDNTYTAMNKHGQLGMGVDVKKLIGMVTPPVPSSTRSGASMFYTFYTANKQDLKGIGILKRFVGSTSLISAELQGCYSKIDFVLQ